MKRTAALFAVASLVACAEQPAPPAAIPPPGIAGAPTGLPAPASMPSGPAPAIPMDGNHGAAMGQAMGQAGAASQPATLPAGSANAGAFGVQPGQGMAAGGEQAGATLTGTVLEAQDIAQYTYVRMKTKGGTEEWAAVNKYPGLKAGDEIVVASSVVMEQFHSPSLNKTFDKITFGMVTKGPMAAK